MTIHRLTPIPGEKATVIMCNRCGACEPLDAEFAKVWPLRGRALSFAKSDHAKRRRWLVSDGPGLDLCPECRMPPEPVGVPR